MTISRPILLILSCITICNCIALPQLEGLKKIATTTTTTTTAVNIVATPSPVCQPSSLSLMEEYFATYAVAHHPHSIETCDIMVKKLNNFAPSNTSSCPWEYVCDHDDNRFPKYIIKAKCLNNYCESCNNEGANVLNECRPVTVPLTVYKCEKDSANPFILKGSRATEDIALACQCDNTSITNST